MSWVYRNHILNSCDEPEIAEGEPKLPPPNTAYQAFDAFRWKRVIGFTERGGYSSMLAPNVDDDCNIIAFAPLDEPTGPDEEKLRKAWPLPPCYIDPDLPILMLKGAV